MELCELFNSSKPNQSRPSFVESVTVFFFWGFIAASNGDAVGVGATMQLPADIRIASNKSRYGFVFARRGIVPDGCASWFLPKLVGISKSLELCYSGDLISADVIRPLCGSELLLLAVFFKKP